MARVWLRDDQFARIAALLSGRAGDPGQALGRSRGGLSTKIHALVEGLGPLARFRLTGGQAGDSPQALPLLQGLHPESLGADKAYDTDAILGHRASNGIDAVIPPRSHRLVERPFDQHHYQNRNLIEHFLCRIKQFRRVATATTSSPSASPLSSPLPLPS